MIDYSRAHEWADRVLPRECAMADGTCRGPLNVAFRHDAPAEFVQSDGKSGKARGLSYYVGPNPADGYIRLCKSHHAKYDAPKLTARRVWLLRKLAGLGVLPKALSEGAGISQPHLSNVLRRKSWRDVPDD